MVARLALALGGLAAALLTPAFALSYFLSYALPEESPPGWLAALQDPLMNAGLLEVGSTAVYDRYGLSYWAAWFLALGGLVALVRRQWPASTARVRRAWTVLVAGLSVVLVGILGDYAPTGDIVGGVGFVLSCLGFVIAAVGSGLLGWALRHDRAVSFVAAVGVGVLGVVSMVGGMAVVGHIPSGPGLGWVAGAVFGGFRGLPLATQGPPPPEDLTGPRLGGLPWQRSRFHGHTDPTRTRPGNSLHSLSCRSQGGGG